MKKPLIFVVILILICIVSSNSCAQETDSKTEIYKNTFISNLGYFPPIAGVSFVLLSAHYERVLTKYKIEQSFIFGISGGVSIGINNDDIFFTSYYRLFSLIGKSSSKFELGLGIDRLRDISDVFTIPAIAIGYRHQNYNTRRIYRIGIGIPEGIYAGMGYRF